MPSSGLVSLEVRGAERIHATTDKAVHEIENLRAGNERAAQHVAETARTLAPKLTGTLAGSVFTEVAPDRFVVATDLVYGSVQEFGAPRINVPAQPWMRPALAQQQEQVMTDLSANVQHALDGIHGA